MPSLSIHNKPVNPLWGWTSVDVVPVEARAMLPSTSYVKIHLAGGEGGRQAGGEGAMQAGR